MARLQILELPEGTSDDRPPFILVIDQARVEDFYPRTDGETAWQIYIGKLAATDPLKDMAERVGARSVLVFEDTIDIPANDLTLTHAQEAADGGTIRLRVEPDLDGFTDTVMAEVARAQAAARAANHG